VYFHHLFNLGLRGAVEAAARVGKKTAHQLVSIALDGIEGLQDARSETERLFMSVFEINLP
jgi:hypothetical protein